MSKTVGDCGDGEESTPKKTQSPLAAGAKYFKKREKTGYPIWEHFTKEIDVNGDRRAKCKYCHKCFSFGSGTTTHLGRHLITCHEGPHRGIAQPLTIAESNESAAVNLPPCVTREKIWEDQVKNAILGEFPFAPPNVKNAWSSFMLMDMEKEICASNQGEKIREDQVKNAILGEFPFAPPNVKNAWSSFMLTDMEKEICASNQGEKIWEDQVKSAILAEFPFAPPNVKKAWSHLMVTDMEKGICAYHQREKEKLVTQLGNLTSRISFSVEIMKKTGWISIAAHFIDDDFNLVKRLIGFKKLHKSCEADIIESCISDWRLENKIFSFTTEWDEDLNKRLQEKFHSKLLFGYHDKFVVPCFKKITEDCYSFHLEDDYVENMKIVENVLACPARMRTFREIAKTKGLPPINEDWSKRKPISLFVETCRNFSSHKGASSDKFCQRKGASSHKWKFFCSLNKKFKEVLHYKEVFNEPSFAEISKPFAHPDCIRWRELEKILNYFETINPIIDLLSSFKHPTSNLYFEKLTTIKKIWEDFGDDMDNPDFPPMCILYAARVLDPRFKPEHTEDLGWGICNSQFQLFFDTLIFIYVNQINFEAYPSSFETADARERYLSTIIPFQNFGTGKVEMNHYLNEEMVDGSNTDFNLLGWWKQKRSHYPLLSRMACDLLAIPACVYSVQESLRIDLTILDEVSPELAEAVICSKDWILSDV